MQVSIASLAIRMHARSLPLLGWTRQANTYVCNRSLERKGSSLALYRINSGLPSVYGHVLQMESWIT
jgi:hypothetical protein